MPFKLGRKRKCLPGLFTNKPQNTENRSSVPNSSNMAGTNHRRSRGTRDCPIEITDEPYVDLPWKLPLVNNRFP